ncbi:TolA protein [Labilithrix luteola]|uniref:TolA protein n=1 Tax=Labilithrix luteola TaxID=1391654 RepID=A0A0K1Q4L7_9BACT|nr:DUF6496 domain-containing protein [Labilithrix luteola]AKV00607.1 TolA protein [Labilithrix luteola]
MPEKKTRARARRDKAEGKSPSTLAGEFVREEIEHVREGKHGAASAKQAIAIGLSKARRAGVELPVPKEGKTSETTRRRASRDYARGHGAPPKRQATRKRAKASLDALEREGKAAATPRALARQAKSAASRRTTAERSAAAKKAVRTKGPARRSAAAKKAVRSKGAAGRSASAKKAARTRAKRAADE